MTGVPQGSNLGPLLFLLYINDLPNCLSYFAPALFADDTNLTVGGTSANEIELKLEQDLSNIHQWLLVNKLTLNACQKDRAYVSRIQTKLSQAINEPRLHIGCEKIKRVQSTKTLGVIVDECVTWDNYIEQVLSKASKGIGLLRRSKDLVNTNSLQTMYKALVISYFDYCALVWGNCSKKKNYKINQKNIKIKQVELSQVIVMTRHQIVLEKNLVGKRYN